ncbi:MAG TPA: NADH-quinone oxidoreductase subunit N [candidate division Zixibacteria bacterium]|nr:NADH-quinone oxidoreductase subunit N [candidate division Zixibacteria bacterium]
MNPQLPIVNVLDTVRLMLPEIFLFVWALVVITVDLITSRKNESVVGYTALFGIVVTGILLIVAGDGVAFGNMFINDSLSLFFNIIFLGAAFMAIGSSFGLMRQKIQNHRGEFYGLIMFSTVGMMFLAASHELVSLYIGLELTTIPLFVLAAFYKDDKLSIEAGIKYFVIGAFSSAMLLYGFSFLYGISGTTQLLQMSVNIASIHLTHQDIGFTILIANVCILAGIGFKLSLPPFHQWAPDVYEGAPTPVASFLSVGSKAAGLVAFAKIFLIGLWGFIGAEMKPNDWGILVGIMSAVGMIIGNVVAIRQTNIKRMLAYSSIAQAGYIMIGMLALNEHGISSVLFYTFVYLFANMGAFAAVTVFEDKTGSTEISNYKGLAQTSPFFAAVLSIFMLSLAGIPPLGGFMEKYKVFAAAVNQASIGRIDWMYWLVGIGLLTSVFSLYYYVNVIKQMYFAKEKSVYTMTFNTPVFAVLVICLLGVLVTGLYPEPILDFAQKVYFTFSFSVLP